MNYEFGIRHLLVFFELIRNRDYFIGNKLLITLKPTHNS
ncbi:hypothetical protein SAMN05444671_3809 [Flavobacterium sp. CF108]|nr:hypothetical protein SAMN05444671_3809 [Flavobacterium sp. CF108]